MHHARERGIVTSLFLGQVGPRACKESGHWLFCVMILRRAELGFEKVMTSGGTHRIGVTASRLIIPGEWWDLSSRDNVGHLLHMRVD